MEVLAFLGGVMGLIAAIIGRYRVIEHRHVSAAAIPAGTLSPASRPPVTVRKRCKRLVLALAGGFLCIMIVGAGSRESPMTTVAAITFAGMALMTAWQCTLIVLTLLLRLWR